MKLFYAGKTRIGCGLDVFKHMYFRFFEKPEVMLSSATKKCADNLPCFLADDNEGFYSVTFLLAGVVFTLSFFGRSIGCSVQSKRITS